MSSRILIFVAGLVLMSGCIEERAVNNPKYCEKDSDCTIEYGVNFQDKCDAGCFNEKYIGERCPDMLWEPFSPELGCECIANQCTMVVEPVEDITTTVDCSNMDLEYCEEDSDCICKDYEGCFIGGRLYWENCINKSEMCTDMCPQDCTCINNRCNCTNYSYA